MKKALLLILALGILWLLIGCSKNSTQSLNTNQPASQETQNKVEFSTSDDNAAETQPAETPPTVLPAANKYARANINSYIILNSDYECLSADVYEKNDGTFTVNIGYQVIHKSTDPVLNEFDLFVAHEMSVLLKAAEENNATISMAAIGISDKDDKPILMWITEDLEKGLLSDYRNSETATYRDVSIADIRELIYPD